MLQSTFGARGASSPRCLRASRSFPERTVRCTYQTGSFVSEIWRNLDVNQFSIITELLGTPPDDVIETICSENVRRVHVYSHFTRLDQHHQFRPFALYRVCRNATGSHSAKSYDAMMRALWIYSKKCLYLTHGSESTRLNVLPTSTLRHTTTRRMSRSLQKSSIGVLTTLIFRLTLGK